MAPPAGRSEQDAAAAVNIEFPGVHGPRRQRDLLPKSALTCLVSEAFRAFAEPLALNGLLADRGLRLAPMEIGVSDLAEAAVLLTLGDEDCDHERLVHAAARHALPIISVVKSWIPGRWRLAELSTNEGVLEDRRLARLFEMFGRHLDDDSVSALVASLYLPETPQTCAFEIPSAWGNSVDHQQVAAIALAHGLDTTSNDLGVSFVADGCGYSAIKALSQGREVVCLGISGFAGLGLTHNAPQPAFLTSAFESLASGRLNNRDRTRRILAVEALFNVIPSDAIALTGSLDAAITATARQARRSVSIVITNYNYCDFVGAAVESALSQTVPAREVIVVDDGSTDGSAELISKIPGIVSILKSNGGQASAFNEGFLRSNGEIILFLDADDRLLPQAVEKIGVVPLRGVSRLQFGLETIDSMGRSTGIYPCDTSSATGHLVGLLNASGGFPFMPTSGNAFPREILAKLMPMPEKNWALCADLYLVLASALIGETVNLDVVLGQYRIHGQNGHFRLLGAEPYRASERIRRQALAWKDLLPSVKRLMPRSNAERSRRALQRLQLTRSVGESPRKQLLPLRALDMAIRAPRSVTITLVQRIWKAIFSLRRGLASDNTSARHSSRRVQTGVENLQDAAGPSTWPLLVPGRRVSFDSVQTSSAMAGVGWSLSSFDGLRMDAPRASLALRLPDCRAHWLLRIAFKVSGSQPLRHLSIWLNGAHLDAVDLRGTGTFDLRLPQELMPLWMPYGGPGARAACLEFELTASDAGRIALQSLELGLLPDVPPWAPCLCVAREISFRRDATNRDRSDLRLLAGEDVLAGGWEWPDDNGARIAGRQARLLFSVSEHGEHAVTVGLAGKPGADLREVLQVVVNDALVEIHPTHNHRSFSFVLPFEGPGRVVVDFEVSGHPATGRWPVLYLSTLRLDTARKADGLPMLVPNVELNGAILEDKVRGLEGLAVDGSTARIVNRNFSLNLFKAPALVGERILLRVSAAKDWAEPVAASFMLGERKFDCWLGPDNLITLPVPDDAGQLLRLRGTVKGPAGLFALRSLRMEQVAALESSVARLESGKLDPLALYSCAEMPEDWHHAIDEALWLAGHDGTIRLPPLEKAVRALDVTVLTIGDPLQRLWLACGAERTQTSKAGLQTLRLPVADATAGLQLSVGCDVVIGATAVGATGPRMLGGAICSIAIVTQTTHG